MDITPGLIQAFLRNQCIPQEAEAVYQYLQQHPEELNAYLPAEKLLTAADELPIAIPTAKMWRFILQATGVKRPSSTRQLFVRMAVAACAIGLLASVAFWFLRSDGPAKTATTETITQALPPKNIHQQNTTNSTLMLHLADGSIVELAPASSVDYPEIFDSTSRRISLEGAALFRVAKDKQRPFTVLAAGFGTTALGTSFTVDATNTRQLLVKLYTGKVVVRKTGTAGNAFSDVYLTPGNQLLIDRYTFSATLSAIEKKTAAIAPKKPVNNEPDSSSGELVFTQTPLPKICRVLEAKFGIRIAYDAAEIRNILFTGSFKNTDTPAAILNTIADLNGLIITPTDGGFTVSKK